MSTESENLYTKNDQLIAQIYDNLSGENKSEEAISLLLNPNHISPTEQVKILGLLGEKDERFHSLLIKTVLNNINILDNSESFKIIINNFIQLVNQAATKSCEINIIEIATVGLNLPIPSITVTVIIIPSTPPKR